MKYICFYDKDDNENRYYVLSAKSKIDYIVSSLEKTVTGEIEIISAATTKDKTMYKARKERVSAQVSLKLFRTYGLKNIFTRFFDFIFIPAHLFIHLILHTKKSEPVVVYHSLAYCIPIALAKKIRHFKMILELEEIYGDVSGNQRQQSRELKFSKHADAFIFPTQLLDEQININHKPSVIIHGTYQEDRKENTTILRKTCKRKKTI